ncbi:MAG: RpiB/LacA/LacB family sugar-phosphate isomerase [Solirubrobacteraceae bacterium]|nr:RpiB/LacA/LacB family sugar-phosphate isomerase [Solirubrobacteraceae bacterium]
MIVALGVDHAGASLRDDVLAALLDGGHDLLDVGEREDYPDVALDVCRAIVDGACERGVLICGSGAGVGVAASKVPGIRAQAVCDSYTAHQAVEHDGVNVLCLGARVIGPALARELVAAFLAAGVEGAPRHIRRRAKVDAIERYGLDAELGRVG